MTAPVDPSLVERFRDRFTGYTKAFGQSVVRDPSDTGKMKARSWTVSGAPSSESFQKHLEGDGAGLGVVMLCEDETLRFGAIDYDDRSLHHINAAKEIAARNLPLVLCRSKSGGGHFYCFTKEPVSAALMKQRLTEWCALLGFAVTTEIFPKQTTRYNDADIGSWINLPYYQAAETTRYAFDDDGNQLSLEEFLDVADSRALTGAELAAYEIGSASSLFADGPPCLQMLEARGGFAEGSKKNGMFDIGVYLLKARPETWESDLPKYNDVMVQIQPDELVQITKSLRKKSDANDGKGYSYQCKQPPINAFCNRALCLTRAHGIGRTAESQVSIENLTRYQSKYGDDSFWIVQIGGQRILLTTADMYHVDRFNIACMSQANVIPILSVTPQKWKAYLNELISRADVIQLPDDATPTGQVWEQIEAFCTQQVPGLSREDVWQGKTWFEGGRTYFRSKDLFAYLEAKRVKFKSETWVWNLLSEHGGQKAFWNINKRGVNVWNVPAFAGREEQSGEQPEVGAVHEEF